NLLTAPRRSVAAAFVDQPLERPARVARLRIDRECATQQPLRLGGVASEEWWQLEQERALGGERVDRGRRELQRAVDLRAQAPHRRQALPAQRLELHPTAEIAEHGEVRLRVRVIGLDGGFGERETAIERFDLLGVLRLLGGVAERE